LDRNLKKDVLPVELEAKPRELERDLTTDVCSAKLEPEPIVVVSDL
jgi:hypothetical protein